MVLDKYISYIREISPFNSNKSFFTYWRRPKKAEDVISVEEDSVKEKIGIVIQGKIVEKDNFTLETIKMYRNKYPHSIIVLSSWQDTPSYFINEIKKIGCEVVLSDIPTPLTGYCNNNLQRISSINGVKKAIELGSEYILKTRTDQRFYKDNVFQFLILLLKKFPLSIKCDASCRLIATSLGTFGGQRLYNISDMFTFGKSEDVFRYYSCPPDDSEHGAKYKFTNDMDFSKLRPGEIYFSTHYIESLGFELKWTPLDSKKYLKDLFLIIDEEMIDLYWPKYNKKEYKWKTYKAGPLLKITFKEWFCLQDN